MIDPDFFDSLRRAIYERGDLFGIDSAAADEPLRRSGARPLSIAIAGGAFGDEGKGRIVDALAARLAAQAERIFIYRWNGGANAGHTVIVGDQRLALHQLPSGSLHENAVVVLGKGMVVHPGDLLAEIAHLQPLLTERHQLDLHVDAQAVLALDTHRAFESTLRDWASGGKGSTGRGISPAYADVLLRHPVRVGDLVAPDSAARLTQHYDLYAALVRGLGSDLASVAVPTLDGERVPVGDRTAFLGRLSEQAAALRPYVELDAHRLIREAWADAETPFIFEGAQGIGLDPRWGVYPDVTASDPTFDGILHSTEGIAAPDAIAVRAGAIKATYMSSVGSRRLPTRMEEPLAGRIREDAHEYGATTRRPRDIAYLDLPCLRFLAEVSRMSHLILTHLDIAYVDTPIRVCTHYTDAAGSLAPYRPDQAYLDAVHPHYVELPSWDGEAARAARRPADLPVTAQQYIAFVSQALGVPPLIGTVGPEREAMIDWL